MGEVSNSRNFHGVFWQTVAETFLPRVFSAQSRAIGRQVKGKRHAVLSIEHNVHLGGVQANRVHRCGPVRELDWVLLCKELRRRECACSDGYNACSAESEKTTTAQLFLFRLHALPLNGEMANGESFKHDLLLSCQFCFK